MKRNYILLALIFWGASIFAQDTIYLNNPSFEGERKASHPPKGWNNHGALMETPPDTQPGAFEVTLEPFEGKSYIGMVVRENDTTEKVGQQLQKPLQAGKCYEFSIHVAKASNYISGGHLDRTKVNDVNHDTPAKLRIWGGTFYGAAEELLGETKEIVNTGRWLKRTFKFEPKGTFNYIILEAFYITPVLLPYNGNVLLDAATPIIQIPCDQDEPIEDPIVVNIPKDPPPTPVQPNTPPVLPKKTKEIKTKEPPKIELGGISRQDMKEGQNIILKNIYFAADSTNVAKSSIGALQNLYDFLIQNPDISIEVQGHTNGRPSKEYADKLSSKRAKSVVDYLISKGISPSRLTYKGYGKDSPIATNETKAGRMKNQRVEVKIIKIKE